MGRQSGPQIARTREQNFKRHLYQDHTARSTRYGKAWAVASRRLSGQGVKTTSMGLRGIQGRGTACFENKGRVVSLLVGHGMVL